ncbi:hypothetical protein F4677DRAFT_439625 [Hypoxylon crocopeplum]|nr:hypothetical protein F4677DRAFT_439625 [Hypoxylon crocopeplum]
MYAECVGSMYENTGFVFTDVKTFQKFMGTCEGDEKKRSMIRPGKARNLREPFLRHTRELQISMSAAFPAFVLCSAGEGSERSAYDLHWLGLDRMTNCRTVNIWIDADQKERSNVYGPPFEFIQSLSVDKLQSALLSFKPPPRAQVTLTTPLGEHVGPPRGFGDELSQLNVRVWKRGTSDRFRQIKPLPCNTYDEIWYIVDP